MTREALVLARALKRAPNCCLTLHPKARRTARVGAALTELEAAGWIHIGNELVGPLAMPTGEECTTLTKTGLKGLQESDQ